MSTFLDKLGAWFHNEVVIVEDDIKAVLNSAEVKALESSLTALAKSELGQLATEALVAATNLETGVVSFSLAAASLIESTKEKGKSLTDSMITLLIAAAQQKLQGITGVITVPAVKDSTPAA